MILKLYSVRNIKRDFYNPPFVIEDEKVLRDVILNALLEADVEPDSLQNFEIYFLGDFDNSVGSIYDNKHYAPVLECSDLMDLYSQMFSSKHSVSSAIKRVKEVDDYA